MRAHTAVAALGWLAAFTAFTAPARAQQAPDLTPWLIADRAAEIALARTAAPAAVSDSATVLALTPAGFVEAARGTNGFTCVVLRGFNGSPSDPGFWNSRVVAPHCFNPPAARTVLPAMLARTGWIIAGTAPAEAEARLRQAYAAGDFVPPAAGSMAYMLSPKQYLGDDDPRWLPHLMFYHDRSLPGSAWGAGGFTAPIIDATAGDAKSPVQVLLVPVPQWSDGTAAPAVASR